MEIACPRRIGLRQWEGCLCWRHVEPGCRTGLLHHPGLATQCFSQNQNHFVRICRMLLAGTLKTNHSETIRSLWSSWPAIANEIVMVEEHIRKQFWVSHCLYRAARVHSVYVCVVRARTFERHRASSQQWVPLQRLQRTESRGGSYFDPLL